MLFWNKLNFFVFISFIDSFRSSLLLHYFKHKYIKNVIVINCDHLHTLKKYKEFSYNGFHYSYCSVNNTCNISATKNTKIGLIINSSCDGWFQILHEVKYLQTYSWVIFTERLNETIQIISKYPVEIDSDVVIVHKRNGEITFYEAYNSGFSGNGSFHIRRFTHSINSRILENANYRHRSNLTGVIMKCVVVVPQPLDRETFENYVTNPKPTYTDTVHRIKFLFLLLHLQDIYNFSLKLIPTNSWGYLNNGSFDGLVGELQRGRADFGGSPLFIRADRSPYLDYAAQTWNSRQCFIFRHPKRSGAFYEVYTKPLSNIVWMCTCVIITVIVLTLYFLVKRNSCSNEDVSLSFVILSVLGAICQQGINIKSTSVVIRAVIFVILLFTLTLFQYYNANVVSTLLHDPPKSIRSLKDLLESSFKVGVEDVLYNKDFFKRTNDPVILELYRRKIANGSHPNFLPPEVGMALVKSGGYAFHVDAATAYRIIKKTFTPHEICELQEVQLYPAQKMAAVVVKNSPYRELITYGLRRMQEVGIYDRLKRMWDEPKPPCARAPDHRLAAVTIGEFSMALCVVIAGTVLALVVLSAELIAYRLNRKEIVFIQ